MTKQTKKPYDGAAVSLALTELRDKKHGETYVRLLAHYAEIREAMDEGEASLNEVLKALRFGGISIGLPKLKAFVEQQVAGASKPAKPRRGKAPQIAGATAGATEGNDAGVPNDQGS